MAGNPGEARFRTAVLGLVVILICCVALGIAGLGVEDRLQPTSLIVPGTESAKGQALAEEHFGDSSPFAVLLSGPAAAIDRQGPGLVRALRRDPTVPVASPGAGGWVPSPPPGPRRAIVLLASPLPRDAARREPVPDLDRPPGARTPPPVESVQSGY